MAKRLLTPVLTEILSAIDGIENAVKDCSYQEFYDSWLIRHAVQRGIEIISEGTRHLPDKELNNYPDIPWAAIKGVGNVLRHEYHRVSDEIIWETVKMDIPKLKVAILDLMANASKNGMSN